MVLWIRSWSMATKQFLLLFLVTFTLFAFLAANNYNRAASLFKHQIVDDAQQLIARTNQFLDTYLDNGQNILLLLSANIELLKSTDNKSVEDFLRSVADNNSNTVKNVYIMRTDATIFSNSQVFYEVLGNPMLPKLYEMAQVNAYSIVSQPYNSPQSGYTVAIARPVFDKQGQRLGVAVVELNLDKLRSKLTELSQHEQTFVLISDRNELVSYDRQTELLPSKKNAYLTELPDDFVKHLAELPVGSQELDGPQGRMAVLKSGQNRLGWSLIFFIKESYFYQNISTLYNDYQTGAMIMLAALLLTAYAMSRLMTHPIRMLAIRMDRVRDMEVVSSITVRRDDEIGRLTRSYNAMMERIRVLLLETKEMEARKKELELKVLQSQIAPHFLYNTLACIGSLARQHRTDEVKETIRALVGVLKFSFDKTSEFVSVDEEMEGLLQYLQIQKTRYGDKFTFEYQVETAVGTCSILKLTLQPIVENAIFHGIAPSRRHGAISLRGEVRRGLLRFVIRDNGVGIEPDRLQGVIQTGGAALQKERFTGIGLNNVHERLRLHFGERYGIKIRSIKNVGTIVVIELPAIPYAGKRTTDVIDIHA
ncbi:cache domain-containing sensor histidine kinase [Paenibacillus roseipurpureus]|uniref:histidine kinase n=1 Tax=Paenibacillus roseopurpureus TaxID=2918901 RepID=A0AA96LUV1_9BACL|nr:sensor histidine kinase [Paenibacillus sp. MBLB1832]WNR46916.1 sensor histidine kinase [Paenibacillus sp. MBLB1832]